MALGAGPWERHFERLLCPSLRLSHHHLLVNMSKMTMLINGGEGGTDRVIEKVGGGSQRDERERGKVM